MSESQEELFKRVPFVNGKFVSRRAELHKIMCQQRYAKMCEQRCSKVEKCRCVMCVKKKREEKAKEIRKMMTGK